MKYLRDFAPHWQEKLDSNDKHPVYAVVKRYYGLDKQYLNMNSYAGCIVGETYHFTSDYKDECGTCREFGKLLNILYTKPLSKRFYELVDDLTMHVNLKHWVTIRMRLKGITKEQIG